MQVSTNRLARKDREIARKDREIVSKDQEIAQHRGRVQQLNSEIQVGVFIKSQLLILPLMQVKNEQLARKDRDVASKDQEIASRDQEIVSKDQEIEQLRARNQQLIEVNAKTEYIPQDFHTSLCYMPGITPKRNSTKGGAANSTERGIERG